EGHVFIDTELFGIWLVDKVDCVEERRVKLVTGRGGRTDEITGGDTAENGRVTGTTGDWFNCTKTTQLVKLII
ncbi:hypothetical protein VIGAN_06156300, partial [Vigna angularis var. angularis]